MSDHEWHAWRPAGKYQPPSRSLPDGPRKPPMPSTTLREMFIEEGHKVFTVALKENVNGRFLRLMEDNRGRLNTVVVPAEALEDLLTVLVEMVGIHKNTPPPDNAAPPAA